jgi:rhamnosyltransferase
MNPATNQIGAIVITFNPNPDLETNISTISREVDILLVIDNASEKYDSVNILSRLEQNYSNIRVIRNKKNLGIGLALNIGAEILIDEGIKWAFTFDQDSYASKTFFNEMKAKQKIQKGEAALLYPKYIDQKSLQFFTNEKKEEEGGNFIAMMSGNLIDLVAWSKLGGFDEDLFIDYVDFDYCLKILKNHLKIYKVNSAILMHNLGQQSAHKLFDKKINTTNHPPIRRYYISRNKVIILKRYFLLKPLWIIKDNTYILFIELCKILFFEEYKFKKFKCIIYGYYDGLKSNLGPCSRNIS